MADTGNNRVQEFSIKGTYIQAFGIETGEERHLYKPHGIAVSAEGKVWVATSGEYGYERIEEFSSSGAFITNIELSAKPEGVTTDAKENVWVTSGSDVWEYSKTGVKLGEFGGLGSGNGQLKEPAGLAVSGADVYVADRGNNRIEEFKVTEKEGKTTAEYLSQFGTKGSGNSQFTEPQDVALDSEGHVWVADAGNNRLQEFKVTEKEGKTTAEYLNQFSKLNETPVLMKSPDGMAFDSSGDVWVADTKSARVDELTSAGKYVTSFGTEGTGNGQFKEPRGIAILGKGEAADVYVADTGNNRVQEFSIKGTFIRAFGTEAGEERKLAKPHGIAVTPEGNVWVATSGEFEEERIEEFSSTGTFVKDIHLSAKPEGVTTDAKEDVWFTSGSDVWEYSKAGVKLGEFGGLGSGTGQLKEPAGLAVAGADVYVADRGNSRIEEFKFTEKEGKTTAEYLNQLGTKGSGNSQFKEPQDVALDSEGHLWVADAGNNRLIEFKPIVPGPLHPDDLLQCRCELLRRMWGTAGMGEPSVSDSAHRAAGRKPAQATGHYYDLQRVGRARKGGRNGRRRYPDEDCDL